MAHLDLIFSGYKEESPTGAINNFTSRNIPIIDRYEILPKNISKIFSGYKEESPTGAINNFTSRNIPIIDRYEILPKNISKIFIECRDNDYGTIGKVVSKVY